MKTLTQPIFSKFCTPNVRPLCTAGPDGQTVRRFDLEAMLQIIAERRLHPTPHLVVDWLIRNRLWPVPGIDRELLVATGTLVAGGPSDGRYIRVREHTWPYRIFLLRHPDAYLDTPPHMADRQLLVVGLGTNAQNQPLVSVERDGRYRILHPLHEPELMVGVHLSNGLLAYLDGSLAGIPTLDFGSEPRRISRPSHFPNSDEGFISPICRFTHYNGHAEHLIHMGLPPGSNVPLLVQDGAVAHLAQFLVERQN